MKKQNVRTLSLIVVTLTYLLVGAALFDHLECANEQLDREKFRNDTDAFRYKYNMSMDELHNLTEIIIKFKPHMAGVQWKFTGAIYFTTTVITTIGYGHSTPQTNGGKIFCMFYALAGIPLGLIMFQSIGERLNILVTYIIKRFKRCFKFRNTEVSQTHLIMVTLNISNLVLVSGAALFSHYEGWKYLDAFYYCFITLTTIGFGDLVALQKPGMMRDHTEYVVFTLLFILFGLAVISAAMNLLVLRFLTMNTEDVRKEELQAAAAARSAVQLDGDVITGASARLNSVVISGQQELNPPPEYNDDVTSVCSCSCYNYRGCGGRRRIKERGGEVTKAHYAVTRSPGKIFHLLPMQPLNSHDPGSHIKGAEANNCQGESNSLLVFNLSKEKRFSI